MMKKTMNTWIFMLALCTMLIVTYLMYDQLNLSNQMLSSEISVLDDQADAAGDDIKRLKRDIELCQTDEYIEDIARKKYNYVTEHEIRIVITNPEVLYMDEE